MTERLDFEAHLDPDAGPPHVEHYECTRCGDEGTYRFGPTAAETSGCLTATQEVPR